MFVCICVLSVVISPFSFLILLIWVISLFFILMSLANSLFGLSSRYLFHLFLLIFMISFLLLTLGFYCSFSSCFRYKVRLFIWLFFCFLRYAYIAVNLSLSTALLNSVGFGLSCFHYHLLLCMFWFPFLFLQWSAGYSGVHCLASMFVYSYSFLSL